MTQLLLAGGGHAHVHVLQDFARQRPAGVELTLVTPYARQMYSGMVPGLVAGHYTAAQCAIPLAPLAAAAGARFIEARVVALDAARRQATLDNGQVLGYELLSLDTGPVMPPDALPGAREHGLFVRPIELFVQQLAPLWDRAARQALDVVVVGAGAAGVELALALAWRLQQAGGPPSRVALVTGGAAPLQGFSAGVQQRVARALRTRGVTLLQANAKAVAADHVALDNSARAACDAAVIAIGASAPAWLRASGLALDAGGFVATGPTLQSLSHPEVFAAGDVAARPDAPHPKSGVYAVRAGPPLAANLRALASGQALQPHQPQRRTLYLLSLGPRRAVASWGPFSAQGGWVWRWKDHIDRGFIARYR